MAKSIQLSKRSTVEVPGLSSFKLVVEAINAQDMTNKIFVNQRIHDFAKESVEDYFVAVATPTQLEDFPENSPVAGSSYYRTNRIELIGRTPEYMQEVFETLLFEVKKLVIDLSDLENLKAAEVYQITATDAITKL